MRALFAVARTGGWIIWFAGGVIMTGCHPIPPPTPPTPSGYVICPPMSEPWTENVCDGVFTPDSYACVDCKTVNGCLDKEHQIYCVGAGGCLLDPACATAKARK